MSSIASQSISRSLRTTSRRGSRSSSTSRYFSRNRKKLRKSHRNRSGLVVRWTCIWARCERSKYRLRMISLRRIRSAERRIRIISSLKSTEEIASWCRAFLRSGRNSRVLQLSRGTQLSTAANKTCTAAILIAKATPPLLGSRTRSRILANPTRKNHKMTSRSAPWLPKRKRSWSLCPWK